MNTYQQLDIPSDVLSAAVKIISKLDIRWKTELKTERLQKRIKKLKGVK